MIIAARRKGIRLLPVLDAIAPGVLVAQAIGRWGNWFNQELFGKPTDLPWALEIDAEHRPPGYFLDDTFHPTFLYEFLWNLGAFFVVVWADRRFRLGHGRVAALYVMAYTLGRGLDRDAAHRQRRAPERAAACASTSGPRSCCSSRRRSTSWSACGGTPAARSRCTSATTADGDDAAARRPARPETPPS